ncbi:conserved exported hypothetical protein [Cupriavidus taiwanensis]|uniref:DUF3016 domain-containing protein n=1 Tax=Cupriavidus taiwanensis TaxID=164546 RepID=UPI000E1074DB|nr:DUF3016 domain-containing protein [Cupriavidus taiwanensis]SOY94476.1 conserved exported hypothetical protein [Cupriavidus taiwanensis]SOY98526.1 conserved exported hypothetical protein [Cupriavidus taiwanensis]SPA40602.1 conserved exported hypothetical protein [Cupriavidus taiwanensis]SPA41532.1 conserved exported protein of unknown function [Cupriavidus taiwanensis]
MARSFRLLAACAAPLALGAVAAPPAGTLSLTFVHPETYTDAAYRSDYGSEKDRAQVMNDIRRHFDKLAARYLPEGYALSIEVLDVDLAGHFEPWHRQAYNVRIVRDVTWPHMTLRYELRGSDGAVIGSGEQRIADPTFNFGINIYDPSDRLRYEKAMMDRWFDQAVTRRIAARQTGQG